MTQLARHFAARPDVRYGLTTLCVGLGQGASVIWENPHHAEYDGYRPTTTTTPAGADRSTTSATPPRPSPVPTLRSPAARHPRRRPERVTHALVRDVALPGGAGVLALVTLDNGLDHTKPTTLGAAGSPRCTRR